MKIFNRYFFSGLLLSLLAVPPLSYAQNSYELTIINHYDKPLDFKVTINKDVLPDLPVTFTLNNTDQVTAKVLDLQKEAYIALQDNNSHNAFWGVEVANDKLKLHGYIGKGIAYSWNSQTIVFCTPDEYKQKGSCLS